MKEDRHIIIGGRRWLLGVAVAALTGLTMGCAEDIRDTQGQEEQKDGRMAVTFGAQTQRTTTRAGVAGEITTTTLTSGAHLAAGFGVFCYYTDDELYGPTAMPQFMFNQQVTYDTDHWTYSPVRYWPNESGSGSNSSGVDRLSFFAYAPYVATSAVTGELTGSPTDDEKTHNIVGTSRDHTAGDPYVHYVTDWSPATSVDLLWGADDSGRPLTNLTNPGMSSHVKFTMRHALARLNLQVDNNSGVADAANTRIWIRSVKLSGIAAEGSLNLNNLTASAPLWRAMGGSGRLADSEVTLYDGRRDGHEGEASGAQPNEMPLALNPEVVQGVPYGDASLTAGVTSTTVNLLAGGTQTAPVFVIPTGAPVNITVDYDVETRASVGNLLADGVTRGTVIANSITASNVFAALEAGKAYTVSLHLGLNDVRFDAQMTDWGIPDPINNDYEYSVSTDQGTSWGPWTSTKPGWLTVSALTNPGEYAWTSTNSTSTATVLESNAWQRNVPGDAVLKAASPVSNVDLSMRNNDGSTRATRTTANCYLIHAPGTYRLPLVYGNAIKDGVTNTSAYHTDVVDGNVITNLVNHNDDAIDAPWITKSTSAVGVDKGMGIAVNGADLIWEDVKGMVKNVAINGDYLTFEIGAENIAEGNAVVAAKQGSTVVWSWHIWVTSETLSSLTNINTGSHTNLSGASAPYRVAPVNVGQVSGRFDNGTVYASEWCRVRATRNGETTVFITKAKDYFVPNDTYHYPSPYYQWGRKDALMPCIPAYNMSGAVIPSYSVNDNTSNTPGYTIQHPEEFCYDSSSTGPYGNGTYKGKYNYWDMNNTETDNVKHATVKTVYDPCPPGFCVPTDNLFNYMTGGGDLTDSNWDSTSNVKTWTSGGGASLSFPASGCRYGSSGAPYNVGSTGYYWSASPSSFVSLSTGRDLDFNSSGWRWYSKLERINAFPVRAVLEE